MFRRNVAWNGNGRRSAFRRIEARNGKRRVRLGAAHIVRHSVHSQDSLDCHSGPSRVDCARSRNVSVLSIKDFDDDLHHEAKLAAAMMRIPLRALVEEALREKLERIAAEHGR